MNYTLEIFTYERYPETGRNVPRLMRRESLAACSSPAVPLATAKAIAASLVPAGGRIEEKYTAAAATPLRRHLSRVRVVDARGQLVALIEVKAGRTAVGTED